MGSSIALEMDGGVAVVTMDDGKVNAMDSAMLDELNERLDEAEKASSIVLAGRPGVFSGGFDMNVLQGDDGAARAEMLHKGAAVCSRLFASPVPVTAAVTGHAMALGAVMAMACDYAVGEEGEYRLALNETAIGMVFWDWAYQIISSRLTAKHVHSAGVLAKIFELGEAAEAGFVNQVAPAGQAVAHAREVAKYLAGHNPAVYRGNKEFFRGERIRLVKADLEKFKKQKSFEFNPEGQLQ